MKKIVSLFTLLLTTLASWAIDDGVPHALAQQRSREITNVSYLLRLHIPAERAQRVTGKATVLFHWAGKGDLVLDFTGSLTGQPSVNGRSFPKARVEQEHIVIPKRLLRKGANRVELEFASSDASLNRHDDYLYTLFVPANARSVFPCFDQPDLKALFSLQLTLPEGWDYVTSADPKHPIPTYLFSFAAGKFQRKTATIDGRTMNALYRETDPEKVKQLDKCFAEAAWSIRWLENYTGIAYPFSKYDFVVLPGYQFGGMEHPGAIQFNARTIFLGAQPTEDDELRRFQLISHETAHMWFGDLVTMRWFDDVWTKEVFANFMASKMAADQFPHVNHELNFLKDHYPLALSIDRTEGTHPIQQQLDNLKNAGLLYGHIIYHKAPIMMQQLEERMGAEALQRGLREYLSRFSYGNATWDDLIDILGKEAPQAGIADFDRQWVKQAGIALDAYGIQLLDAPQIASLQYRLSQGGMSEVDRFRAAMTLYENYLHGRLAADSLVQTMLRAVERENNPLVATSLVGYATSVLPYASDRGVGECKLLDLSRHHSLRGVRTSSLRYLSTSAQTEAVLDSMFVEWQQGDNPLLTVNDWMRAAYHLAQYLPSKRQEVLSRQRARLATDDARAEFDFVSRGCDTTPAVQDSLFASLLQVENRRVEPWAAQLLSLLNDPISEPHNNRFLLPALDALEEVQRTSAIFFPGDWLAALLSHHRSEEARALVSDWITRHPDYPAPLMNKVKQNAYRLLLGR